MKKVLVTGGAGFIGSHTCVELLQSGYLPVIVDDLRNSHERILDGIQAITGHSLAVHRVDCTDATALGRVMASEGDLHGVIHFAAYKSVNESVAEPVKYYANNIGSLSVLVELAQRHGLRRIVFSSSCSVYGQADHLPVTEDAPADRTNSPYAFTKVACEHLLHDLAASDASWRVMLLRYFNPIGAHPSGLIGELPVGIPNNLVPFVVQAAAGRREALTIFGNDYNTPDGTCLRDYIHVVDLARAHVQALALLDRSDAAGCATYNIGTGRPASVKEVVETFERVTGVPVPVRIGPRRPGDVASIYADTARAAQGLGWRSEHDLGQALRDAWKWQQHLEADAQAFS